MRFRKFTHMRGPRRHRRIDLEQWRDHRRRRIQLQRQRHVRDADPHERVDGLAQRIHLHRRHHLGGGSGTSPDTSNSDSGAVYNQATGFTQLVAQGPNNSLDNYWDLAGQPWSSRVVAGGSTTFSAPTAVYNQSSGFTQVIAQGPNNSLDNYWSNADQLWYSGTVAGAGTTYSAP